MKITKEEIKDFDEYQELLKGLQPYIESARSGDGKAIRSSFYDHAHIVGSMDGNFVNYTADQFGETVGSLGASNDVRHHIAWVDISGPMAAVKLEFVDWLGFRFTDFLILYKVEGEWKISGKVFNSHSRN